MIDYDTIYQTRAMEYDQLVAREDYQDNLLPALAKIRPLAGLDVIESGAGTGRLTMMLTPLVRHIRAFDASAHMLAQARTKLLASGQENWRLQVALHENLPLEPQSADLFISGWSFCYTALSSEADWQNVLTDTLATIKQVIRPGGTIIIIETQGTGFKTPTTPDSLTDYLHYLESEAGFSSTWVRTDYQFQSLEEAIRLSQFFFGDELAHRVKAENWVILPECTGIWWLHV